MKTNVIEDNNEKNNNSISEKDQSYKGKTKIKNIFKQYFKVPKEKKKKKEIISIKDYAFLDDKYKNPITPLYSNETNNNNNESNGSVKNKKRINKSIDYSNKTLFTKSEKIFLSKLIPDKCLDNYQNKFNSLLTETMNIKSKIGDNLKEKSADKNNNLLKLESSSLQNNLMKRKIIKLRSKICEYNKKKLDMIDKIKDQEKELKNYDDVYKKTNHEFKVLLQYFKEFYEQIQNRKYALIQGEQLTDENINAMDRYGMRGSNNTSIDGFNEDVDYANVSEYENEEIEDEKKEDNENEDNVNLTNNN
jgi:hypothetical protein